MSPARDSVHNAGIGRWVSAFSGRVLAGPAINRSPHAWASTVYNAEGLIVSAPDADIGTALRAALLAVFDGFDCRPEGRRLDSRAGRHWFPGNGNAAGRTRRQQVRWSSG